MSNAEIAEQVNCSVQMIGRWRQRFAQHPQLESLEDQPRSGRPAQVPLTVRCEVIRLACQRPDDEGREPFRQVWTLDSLKEALYDETDWWISRSEIWRILQDQEIRPHRMRLWLHSQDPDFRVKVERICHLYLEPPPGAVVLCVDEKSAMQALQRKYPIQWPGPQRSGRFEFEYIRHGTRTLIAAFEVETGKVFGQCRQRRTAQDLMEFMDALAQQYPAQQVYVIWDNLNIHHGARWEEFNQRHGDRFHFVYTPLHASWVNQIEIWFGILHRRLLKYGDFFSVDHLVQRVEGFITYWNQHEAHPFAWKFRGFPSRAPLAA